MSMGAMQIIKEKTSKLIVTECFPDEMDIRSQWSWMVATLYGFGILTTLGYGRIEVLTTAGRLFCVVFGIIGIPLMMLTFANIGKYINEFGPRLRKKLKEVKSYMKTRKDSLNKSTEESEHEEMEDENDGAEISPVILTGMVIVYLVVGAVLLPLLNGRFDFVNGIYYTFLCMSVIEFGVLVPEKMFFNVTITYSISYVPIVLLYICVGLSITSIAIEFGADYVKKIHFIGRRLSRARFVRIWFGGNTLRVHELLEAVAKNWGVDPDIVRDTNLDEIVEMAIKVKQGKVPPNSYIRREWFGIWPPELLPLLIKEGGIPRSVSQRKNMYYQCFVQAFSICV